MSNTFCAGRRAGNTAIKAVMRIFTGLFIGFEVDVFGEVEEVMDVKKVMDVVEVKEVNEVKEVKGQ